MSSNISGFQGVNTPLQSMTNGKYTLADYTKMNTTFGARITALEKATAFNPNNVTIGGSLSIQPNSTQAGTLSVASNGTINGSLTVAKTLTVTQNAIVNGALSVAGGITFNTLNANNVNTISIVNSGAITSQSVTATSLSGNGATITGVQAVSAPYSGLTGLVPTWNQSTTGNALTATNVAYTGLTGVVPTWNQNTTGNAATATTATNATNSTNLAGGIAGKIPYQSNASTTLFTAVGSAGQVLTSQGTAAPTWTAVSSSDPTKLPLAGGIMSGTITAFNINFTPGYNASNYKRNFKEEIVNTGIVNFTPLSSDQSTHDYIRLMNNTACTINLQNMVANTASLYQDGMRLVTITKAAMSAGDYVVTVLPPNLYLFSTPTGNAVASTTMALGTFSVTFMIYFNSPDKRVDLISKV